MLGLLNDADVFMADGKEMLPLGIFGIGIRQSFRHRNLVVKCTQRVLVISECVLNVGDLVVRDGNAALQSAIIRIGRSQLLNDGKAIAVYEKAPGCRRAPPDVTRILALHQTAPPSFVAGIARNKPAHNLFRLLGVGKCGRGVASNLSHPRRFR